MIIKIKAVVVCDNCNAEVECVLPVDVGSPEHTSQIEHPQFTQGRSVVERFGRASMEKYLCDKCTKARGYDNEHRKVESDHCRFT